LWLRKKPKTPEQLLEARLLDLWRRRRLESQVELFPLWLMLKHQSLKLAAIRRDEKQNSNTRPELPRATKSGEKPTPIAKLQPVRSLIKFLSRRRCLQPVRVSLVQLRRKILIGAVTLLVKAVRRQFRGRRTS
jgi:hypothetical protein